MSASEWREKEGRVRRIMQEKGLDAVLIRNISNFAWLTDGVANYVGIATAEGNSWALLTPDAKYIITNNIEAARLERDELLAEQGYRLVATPWHEAESPVARLTQGMTLGADGSYPGATNVSAELARWRQVLLPGERQRYRELCADCGEAIQAAAMEVQPGLSEHQIAGLVARQLYARGITPLVLLIAVDENVWRYRHPLPTNKIMERYAMLVVGGRRRGLIGSVSRLVHFGALSEELQRKEQAVARVDATIIAATRPGALVADIFRQIVAAYAEVGYADEWRYHHQGGAIGYESREFKAMPDSTQIVQANQAYAWNPSIAGVKSEDTILIGENSAEIMTDVGHWPMIPIEIGGQVIRRPAILRVM